MKLSHTQLWECVNPASVYLPSTPTTGNPGKKMIQRGKLAKNRQYYIQKKIYDPVYLIQCCTELQSIPLIAVSDGELDKAESRTRSG